MRKHKNEPSQVETDRPSLREVMTDKYGVASVRSAQTLIILLLSVAVVFALIQLKIVVIPLLIAVILASAVSPVSKFLREHGVPRIFTSIIILVLGGGILAGIVTLIVFAVRDQWGDLAESATEGIDTLTDFVKNGPVPIDQDQIDSARAAVGDFITSAQFGLGAVTGVAVAGEIITSAVLAIVILFFFIKDGDKIWNFFLKPLNSERTRRGHRVGQTAVGTLGGYVRGTAIVALVDATFIGIGLAILQVPLALPLAVIVFLFAFIPIVGATVAGGLAALVALVGNGPVSALLVIIIVITVNQIEGNLLQPIVMGKSLSLHPLVILLALTAGTILGGIVGAVLSVPIAAVAWAIIKVWNGPDAQGDASSN